MIKRTKLWTNISAATLASIATVGISGCDSSSDGSNETTLKADVAISEPVAVAPIVYEGEGEGEGGAVNLSTNDIAYLTRLALMRGHLFIGNELYAAGHISHAQMHMKHPKSELYNEIEPAFDARGALGFAEQLTTLSAAVEAELDVDIVANAYSAVTTAISDNESVVPDTNLLPSQRLKLVSEILRVAGEEYAIAVVDGQVKNAHEYQDAMGFTEIAAKIIESIDPKDGVTTEAIEKARKHIDGLSKHWPSLIPPPALDTQASALYVAAARIELLALGL